MRSSAAMIEARQELLDLDRGFWLVQENDEPLRV